MLTAIYDPDTNQCFEFENEKSEYWLVTFCVTHGKEPEDGMVITEPDKSGLCTMVLPKRPDRRVFDGRDIDAWVAFRELHPRQLRYKC